MERMEVLSEETSVVPYCGYEPDYYNLEHDTFDLDAYYSGGVYLSVTSLESLQEVAELFINALLSPIEDGAHSGLDGSPCAKRVFAIRYLKLFDDSETEASAAQ